MLPGGVLLAASKPPLQLVENRCVQTMLGKGSTNTDFPYPVVMCPTNFRHVCECSGQACAKYLAEQGLKYSYRQDSYSTGTCFCPF